jgi:D-alanyl-D-alanine carboxypeptidase
VSDRPTESRLASGLETTLAKAVDRSRDVRHGLLGVAALDGSWSWVGAHGALDPSGTPANEAARYPVASVTKLFTAAVVFRLVEQSGLRLDDRIVDLLPSDVTDGLHVLDGVDHTSEITVAHLLGHTSGLADYYEEAPPGGISAQARLLAGEDAPMPFDEVLRVVREELKPHFPPQRLDAPRVKAKYTDTNYQLLGAIIERVTEQRLHETFGERIFEPLGLDHTSSYPYTPRSGVSPEPDANVWSKDTVLEVRGR